MTSVLLKVEGLRKNFGALRASDNVDLEVQEGETLAVIGPNGAGKTTLISQLAGNLRPDAGRIRFAGEDITPLSAPKRSRKGLPRAGGSRPCPSNECSRWKSGARRAPAAGSGDGARHAAPAAAPRRADGR